MFVLQDCSICFEDYGPDRIPHSVACGHVFCRPCLDSLVSSSSNCPNCRASIGRKSIRKVVCAHQDPPALDDNTLSEAEMIMWQAIESAVESIDEYEQRRSLVRDNSKLAVREAGFSGNMIVALDVMRLLVEVESTNYGLNDNIDAARAMEESLRDRISFLEAQLSGTKANFNTTFQDFQKLVSEMQQLKSSMRIMDETAAQITRQLTSSGPLPTLPDTRTSPPDYTRTSPSQEQTRSPPQSQPLLSTNTSSTGSWAKKLSFLAETPAESASPPMVAQLPYRLYTPRTTNPTASSSARVVSGDSQIWASPVPSQAVSWSALLKPSAPTQVRQCGSQSSIPSSSRQNPPPSTHTPARTITAACDYTPDEPNELSLISGETLKLVHDSADLDDESQWVWCRARGMVGLVPRSCLNVV